MASINELSTTNAIWSSLSLDAWKDQNMPTAEKTLIDYTEDLFSKAKKASEESVDIIKKGEDYINKSLA